jgi:hypothetical protein
MDAKLTLREHVKQRISKAHSSFWLCRRTLCKTWVLEPKIAHWLYTDIVRPMLMYAAIVWWPRFGLAKVRAELGCLQRLACLSINEFIRTTPTAALVVVWYWFGCRSCPNPCPTDEVGLFSRWVRTWYPYCVWDSLKADHVTLTLVIDLAFDPSV